MNIFGILSIILITAVVVFMTNYRDNKQKKKEAYPLAILQNQRKELVEQALKALNCEGEWKNEDDEDSVAFEFQGGHFNIRITKDSPYISLLYLFFYQSNLEEIQIVRAVCNTCNINTENTRIVYSIPNGSNEVDVHAITSVLLDKSAAQQILKRAMTSSFQMQNSFARQIAESRKKDEETENHDPEKQEAMWKRELDLLSEQEIMHQVDGPEWRSSEAEPLGLKNMLATALDLRDIVPQQLTIVANNEVDTMVNADAILAYHLSKPLVKGGDFVADEAMLNLKYTAPSKPDVERTLTIHLKAGRKAEQALYFRITTTVVPLPIGSEVPLDSRDNQPAISSFLVAFDLSSPKQRLDKFHYMWKEALELVKTNPEELSEEQRLICECLDPDQGFNIYSGSILFRDKRFYEAIHHLEMAFQGCKPGVNGMKASEQERFLYICYLIGFCYSELRQYEKAYYYLDMTMPLRRITYTQEYVNCLVNSTDFRALDIINNLLNDTLSAHSDEDEELPAHIKAFVNFLKRRKAYVLIDQEKIDEAKTMLQEMLNEPENSDFAISELAYLQKRKGVN